MNVPQPGSQVWIDGTWLEASDARVAIGDPTVQGGVGAFETIAVRRGRLLDVDAHLDRLEGTCERFSLGTLDRWGVLEAARVAAGRDAGPACGFVKILRTGGGRTIAYAGPIDPATVGASIRLTLLPGAIDRRDPTVGWKTLSYARSAYGFALARSRGADEGVWRNDRGHLVDACYANLFVLRHRKLYTASTRDGALPGVARALVLHEAPALGLATHVGKLREVRLRTADEVFVCSSLRGVRPVTECDGLVFGVDGRPGSITSAIAGRVEAARCVDAGSGAEPSARKTENVERDDATGDRGGIRSPRTGGTG